MERYLKEKFKQIQDEVISTTVEVGNDIAEESLHQCPKDTGALRESQKMRLNGTVIKRGGKVRGSSRTLEPKLTVGYNTEYAMRQHEDMTFNHPYPGTKAKYLTDPLNMFRDEYNEKIKERISKVIKK